MNLTEERRRRTEAALRETEGQIAKEMKYSPEFRDQGYLQSLNEHKQKLEDMLSDAPFVWA
jgi:hypothetical protein